MLRAIGMRRQADHKIFGLPFFDQLGNGLEFFIIAVAGYRRQRMGHAQLGIPLRHADTRLAEVKGQNRAFWCIRHGRLLKPRRSD